MPAEESGVIELLAEDGDTVEVGQVVCKIDMDAKAPEGDVKPAAKKGEAPNPGPAEPKVSPVKRKLRNGNT